MDELKRKFEDVFRLYQLNYERIFDVLYPAKNNTGFTERNLSVNFCKAYESLHPEAISWYEFQFGAKNNLHYDAVIINPTKNEVLLIESKRFSHPKEKIAGVYSDIARINDVMSSYCKEFMERIYHCSGASVYGVILADVWTQTKRKTEIWDTFKRGAFITRMLPEGYGVPTLPDCTYFVNEFPNVKRAAVIRDDYKLLSLVWKVGNFPSNV